MLGTKCDQLKPQVVAVSWETCNPNSEAIHYEESAKAGNLAGFGQYIVVGPYNPALSADEFQGNGSLSQQPLCHRRIQNAWNRISGISGQVACSWISQVAIRFDVTQAQRVLNLYLYMIHNTFPVKISDDDILVTYGIVFGCMTAAF